MFLRPECAFVRPLNLEFDMLDTGKSKVALLSHQSIEVDSPTLVSLDIQKLSFAHHRSLYD